MTLLEFAIAIKYYAYVFQQNSSRNAFPNLRSFWASDLMCVVCLVLTALLTPVH